MNHGKTKHVSLTRPYEVNVFKFISMKPVCMLPRDAATDISLMEGGSWSVLQHFSAFLLRSALLPILAEH